MSDEDIEPAEILLDIPELSEAELAEWKERWRQALLPPPAEEDAPHDEDLPELATYSVAGGSSLFHRGCDAWVRADMDGIGVCDCGARGRV